MSRVYLKPGLLTRWRQFAGIKQSAIAHDCGWTQSSQSHAERGKISVPRSKLNIMHQVIESALQASDLPAPSKKDLIQRGGKP